MIFLTTKGATKHCKDKDSGSTLVNVKFQGFGVYSGYIIAILTSGRQNTLPVLSLPGFNGRGEGKPKQYKLEDLFLDVFQTNQIAKICEVPMMYFWAFQIFQSCDIASLHELYDLYL